VKKVKLTYFLVVILALAGCFTLHAQNLTASANKTTVGVGEQIQVDYTATVSISSFAPPAFTDFRAQGPYQSSSMEIANGVSTQSVTLTYVLVPTKEGTFTIGPASAKSGGKTITSNSLTIKVVKGGSAPSAQQNVNDQLKKNILLRIIPQKTRVYLGEELPVMAKIYFRVNIEPQWQQDNPNFSGFYTMDIPPVRNVTPKKEVLDGVQYSTVEFPLKVLYAQRSGKIVIDPLSLDLVVDLATKSNDPIQQMLGMMQEQRLPYTVKSEPVTIDVLPLPETDKPFSGLVGHFTMKSTLDKSSVKANDAVNLNVTVSGDGGLKLLDSIPFKFPTDFDHFDPKITDHLNVSSAGVSGSRNFSYVIIPRHQGAYKIPAVEFTYFDPAKKSYETLTMPEISLDVAKGDNTSASQITTVNSNVNKEDIKLLGSDIRFIHTGHMPSYELNNFFLFSIPFFAGIITPLLCFAGFLFARRRYIELNKDIVSVKQRGATRMAKKRLTTAFGFIASGNKESFYEEVHKAVNSYLSDKFTIPVADLSRETIVKRLTEKSVTPDTIQKLSAVLDDCEYARYAPASVTGNLQQVYDSTVTLITALEDEIAA